MNKVYGFVHSRFDQPHHPLKLATPGCGDVYAVAWNRLHPNSFFSRAWQSVLSLGTHAVVVWHVGLHGQCCSTMLLERFENGILLPSSRRRGDCRGDRLDRRLEFFLLHSRIPSWFSCWLSSKHSSWNFGWLLASRCTRLVHHFFWCSISSVRSGPYVLLA